MLKDSTFRFTSAIGNHPNYNEASVLLRNSSSSLKRAMKTTPGNLLAKDLGNADKLFSATLTRVSYCVEECCRPHDTPWAGLCQCTALWEGKIGRKRERLPVAKWEMRHKREKGKN